MECQNTIKNLKFNKDKNIGTIVVVVEGEKDEFILLKHIFTKILDYNYTMLPRGAHRFDSKGNKNSNIIVVNTSNSNISSIKKDDNYKEDLYSLLKNEYDLNVKNTSIYFIWDREFDSNKSNECEDLIHTFQSALDNNYEMNGLILLRYPCLEVFGLANFSKGEWKKKYKSSDEAKRLFKSLEVNGYKKRITDIEAGTILVAAKNMHESFIEYGIDLYDQSNFHEENIKIYRRQELNLKLGYYDSLSLICVMLVDLGIIVEKDE